MARDIKLDELTGYRLVRAALRVRRAYSDALAEIGLLPNHHAILAMLAESGPSAQKYLAAGTVVDAADLVGYLDTLEKGEYISRASDPADRRRRIVSLTPKGRRKLTQADNRIADVEQRLFGGLTEAERSALTDLADRVAEATN